MDPIYTQEQADSLIESAVSKALANAEEETAKAVADAKSEAEKELETLKAELASLQEARDADQMALATEKQKVADLEGEIASRDEAVARLARRAERLEKVGEAAKFSDEYLEQNADRWADMDEEQFASVLDAYKDMASHIKVQEKASEEDELPEETAMRNERVETPKVSARSALFSYTLKGGSK
jgi:septal ring factor EnvC (AmiA/AmiB activator)